MKSNSAQYIYFSALMVCMGHLSGIAYHDVPVLGVYLVLIKLLIYLRTLHIFWRAYYIYFVRISHLCGAHIISFRPFV